MKKVKPDSLDRFKDEGQPIDEIYFGKFDLERICLDKIFFVVYDERYSQVDHEFDKELRDRFIQHIKRSRVKKGRFEQVLRKESDYSSWELQLRGPRTMYFHVNVIHYLQQLHSITPKNVIYDDNFMPTDTVLTVVDYVKALRAFAQEARRIYHDIVYQYWKEDLLDIKIKFAEVEVPFEVYPASVDDIATSLYAKGISFRKYNTQSGTIYLNQVPGDNEISVPERKYDKVDKISNNDLSISPDIVYLNKIDSGRSLNRIQVKIYQKTFGLCRIEFTLYSKDANSIFNFSRTDHEISLDLVGFIHYNLKLQDIHVERYDRSLDDIVRFLSVALKEPEDLIYQLRGLDIFEAGRSNRVVKERLTRKGILLKKVDSDGIHKRGYYLVNPIIREFLNLYQAKGNEHFVKNSLFPGL